MLLAGGSSSQEIEVFWKTENDYYFFEPEEKKKNIFRKKLEFILLIQKNRKKYSEKQEMYLVKIRKTGNILRKRGNNLVHSEKQKKKLFWKTVKCCQIQKKTAFFKWIQYQSVQLLYELGGITLVRVCVWLPCLCVVKPLRYNLLTHKKHEWLKSKRKKKKRRNEWHMQS